jgi:electron transport complex protein RnfA
VNGDGFVTVIVAVALANRLLLAPPPAALPALRAVALHAVALHGVISALVATLAIIATAAVNAALEPLALLHPHEFLAIPVSAVLTVLAARLLPRWRGALRDTDWRLVGANAVALVVVGTANTPLDATALLLRAFATASMFALALVVLCALEQRTASTALPHAFRGVPIALLNAGLLALAGQGLAGLLPA